jgi:hypothetical protein
MTVSVHTFSSSATQVKLASCIVPPKALFKVGENGEGLLVRDSSRNLDDLRLREILHYQQLAKSCFVLSF